MSVFEPEDQQTVNTIGMAASGFAALTVVLILLAMFVTG